MLKPFLLVDAAIASFIGATSADATASKVILYAGALTALGLFWRTFGKPALAILKRTAAAVEALETLVPWRQDHDERLADVEAEVGIVHTDLGKVANDVAAIRRDLGISDSDVRAPPGPSSDRIRRDP